MNWPDPSEKEFVLVRSEKKINCPGPPPRGVLGGSPKAETGSSLNSTTWVVLINVKHAITYRKGGGHVPPYHHKQLVFTDEIPRPHIARWLV